ncbi:hypothetical protein [uncultured Rubinisphaera sp.]|uniref:hypothetical protein n=1 Tax=uncultured Rubinisphaera sp. TaxID=1678686 RepID=UPI000EC71399|nr:hypothetical protein [Planctomycetaceae bacterium]
MGQGLLRWINGAIAIPTIVFTMLVNECVADELEDILAAWRHRSESVQAVQVDYEGEVRVAEGYYSFPYNNSNVLFPSKSSSFDTKGNLLLDLADKRLRFRFEEKQPQQELDGSIEWVQRNWTACLTSEYLKEFRPSELNGSDNLPGNRTTDLYIHRRPGTVPIFEFQMYPLLFASGQYGIGINWQRSPFESDLTADNFKVVSTSSYNGRDHIVIQTTPFSGNTFFEYWVDLMNPMRVHRFVVNKLEEDGKLTNRADIDITYRDEELGPVPSAWKATIYMIGSQVSRIIEVRSISYEFDVAVESQDFDIIPPYGTHVRDLTRPAGAQRYVVGETDHPESPTKVFQE